MTIKNITEQFDRISADSIYFVGNNFISLTINDFDGFDADWCEIEREIEDAETIEEVLNWLEENADSMEGDFYRHYYFGNLDVQVGYASYDI